MKDKTRPGLQGPQQRRRPRSRGPRPMEKKDYLTDWVPKTELGKNVMAGTISSLGQVFEKGLKILEPQVVDKLAPELEHEIVLIGGSPGKGGGIKRTPSRRTARMHKSGRRFRTGCMIVAGNKNGYVGLGYDVALDFGSAVEKALKKAKLNMMPIRRGCGSWQCKCGTGHTIPARMEGKSGSVRVILMPAPKGIGLVASNELKKVFRLAGIKDIWVKSFGNTAARVNHIRAVFDALKKLNRMKIPDQAAKSVALVAGAV